METIEKGLYLGSIISPGIDGDLVLLGFPYEIGTKRAGIPCSGLENGPDCLRRFLPKLGPLINPEQNLSIQSLRLKDYGNLIIKEKDPSLEDLLLKLETKCLSIMKRKGIPLVLGGGHEVALGGVRALCGVSEGKNGVLHVNIRAGLDCEIFYDGNKVTSRNVLRKLITEAQEEKKEYKAFCFSVEEALLTKHEIDFLKENTDRIEVYSMKKIRKVKVQSDISDNVFEPITQAGQGLVNFLKGVKENIYVSFSLEAINVMDIIIICIYLILGCFLPRCD